MTAVACLALVVLAGEAQGAPRERSAIRWIPEASDTNKVAVEVSGLSARVLRELRGANWTPAQWRGLLTVRVEHGDLFTDVGIPPMQGDYRVRDGILRFEPQFPLEPGVRYRASFHPEMLPGTHSGAAPPLTAAFEAPARPVTPATFVARVYPSSAFLPENLLKFYVHFSAPMSRGHIYDYVRLRDAAGRYVELPFLELDEELWDPTMTRLTLIIDPGRIKRGVQPLEEIGPALEEGKSYVFELSRKWKDAAGVPLKADFQKTFKVGPPDRQPPDPARWRIQAPNSRTRDPLRVTFPEPMDHALARRMIRVTRDTGEPVEGETALEDEEWGWLFTPASPWRRGNFRLLIQTTIEDLAGNNIGKAFDVDLVESTQRALTNSTVKVSFEVR
ncbi:MAG TPA: hypothetical protein VFT34_09280 [Verrucomicrobiae bacterium]|nr:hypothetical protein [Verrucomicrobiae bacterium]